MKEIDTKLKFEKKDTFIHECVNLTKVVYYPLFLKIGKGRKKKHIPWFHNEHR